MKAQLISYSYTEHEDDFHKGLKTWQEHKKAIIIPELNVIVVEWKGKVHFFLMKGFDNRFALEYYPYSDNIKLPQEYEVIRVVQVDDKMAKWAYAFVDSVSEEIKEMQTRWRDKLRQEVQEAGI